MTHPVLVLIDLQNDFLTAPRLEPHPATVVAGAARLLQAFRDRGLPVVHVRTKIGADGSGRMPHWVEQDIRTCLEGSPGYDAPAPLRPREHEPVFDKTWFSAFTVPAFDAYLRGAKIETVVLAGLYWQTCVRQTALDAYQRGFRVRLARDAGGSHDPLHGALTLDYLAARSMPALDTATLLAGLEGGESPATGATASLAGVVSRLRSAQAGWAVEPIEGRIEKLRALVPGLERDKENLARIIVQEVKKPILFARGEVDRAIALVKVVAARAEKFDVTTSEAEGKVRHHPRGVVAMITPWNNPLAIPMGKLMPALVFGNAVLWKPSPFAPRIAQALLPLLDEAGLPTGLVRIVEGDERQARRIIASGIDAVAFSGSSRTGWSIIAQTSARLLPVQAELGGNNAAIVCPSADLKAAAAAIAEGAFGFAGQRCTSNRRAIVLDPVYDDFLAQLDTSTRDLPAGDPWRLETRITPMISPAAARSADALVERARSDGFRVLQPQPPLPEAARADGAFQPPAIVLCDDPASFIVQEESFAPILVVQRARDFSHAVELLNGVPHGLVAALFSQDRGEQDAFLQSAQAGILKLNASTVNAGVDLPFTGWKHSGCGAAEHGEANAEFFTKRQAIYG
jgi:acyl-CoA reductase-like NAD-dependent aldehyde dehydrogenase/nicotinamidase-related amidase